MKILHTADLHIGRRLNDISLIEDQEKILNDITDIAKEEGCSAVLISGDIYDKSAPAAEAMVLFDSFISRLCKEGIKIFAVSGNHDSEDRIEYFSSFLDLSDVHIYGRYDGRVRSYTLSDGDDSATIYLLPFVKPHTVRPFVMDKKLETYEDAVSEALALARKENTPGVKILLAHQFVTGAAVSDSEEASVGGLDNVSASVFDGFDYVALGHIHKPQSVCRDTVCYSGSPLKYSLSEAGHTKSVSIVEICGKDIKLSRRLLDPIRDVREITGYFEDIMKMNYSEDFVKITLQDDMVMPDARVTLSTVFPNMIRFSAGELYQGDDTECSASAAEGLSADMLFSQFYTASCGTSATDEMMEIVSAILRGEEVDI